MQFRDLPPLHFLPAFEAAGRLESIKSAAAELHVTPSAISQQLKAVEAALGVVLFERRTRAIRLTPTGADYLREVQQALSDIAGASRRARRRTSGRELRLTLPDYLAYEFILPRLSAFRARFPGIEPSLDASARVVDFGTCDVDAAIRVAEGRWPGLRSRVVGDAWVAPVCAPSLAHTIRTQADLADQPLIELRSQVRRGWRAFMQRAGEREPQQVLAFEGYLEVLRAAEQGLGVAFGIFPLITDWVTSGRLAVPLALRVPFAGQICFLYRTADTSDPLFDRVYEWICEHYAALPALAPGRHCTHKQRLRVSRT